MLRGKVILPFNILNYVQAEDPWLPILSVFLPWGGLHGFTGHGWWVRRWMCVCVCWVIEGGSDRGSTVESASSPGLDRSLHRCQSGHRMGTEGPFTPRSVSYRHPPSSPPNLLNIEVCVKTCRKKVFVLSAVALQLSSIQHRQKPDIMWCTVLMATMTL